MDKERSRDLMMRGRSSASRRFSPARRHPMRSSSPTVYNRSDGGDRDGSVPSSWKKEKVRGSRSRNNEAEGKVGGAGSEGEEGDPFRPPLTTTTTNSVTARKRVRLHGKTSEDCDAVDPASVPRKLRSAINKRSNQSASPPLPDTRKKRPRTSNDAQLPYIIDENKSEQNTLTDSMTKDEEEVAETLFALANMMPVCEPIEDKEERKASDDMPNMNATNASHSEASKEEDANNSQPCAANEVINLASCSEEPISETAKAESALEHPATISGSQAIEPEPNKSAQSDVQATLLLSKIDHAEITSSMNAANSLKSSGASSQYYSGNGSLQPPQHDALPALSTQKPDILAWPFGSTGSAAVKHVVQADKQRIVTGTNVGHQEEIDPSVHPRLPSSTQAPLTMLSPSKNAVWPGSATSTIGLNSTGNGLQTEKRPAMPLNVLWLQKKCATHVYLTHLIRHHQNMERKSSLSVPRNQSKSEEGSNMGVPAASETAGVRNGLNCMGSAGTNGSLVERNVHEARIQMLHSERLLRAQQASKLSETYAPQKQLQLQVPQYMGSAYYGPQMVHAGGTRPPQQQHQQPMWPTYLGHYRPPMGVPVWQNGRLHDISRQLRLCPPASAANSPSPAIEAHAGAYHPLNPPQQHHLHVNPSLSSSSRTRHRLNGLLNNGGFRPEVRSPLQLLCNAQRS